MVETGKPDTQSLLDLLISGAFSTRGKGVKRGLKRSPSGWRGFFSRSKQQRQRAATQPSITAPCDGPVADVQNQESSMPVSGSPLRPVKSCESLHSECDAVAPLAERSQHNSLRHHSRSASCDSYFEPWQAEIAEMRLRLSPQERDGNIFSEEDDTAAHGALQTGSLCSSPVTSGACSVEPSPRRPLARYSTPAPAQPLQTDNGERKRSKLEEQLSSIGYIDVESPVRAGARGAPAAEKRHSDEWPHQPPRADDAKRVCKDRDSPVASVSDFPTALANVKLRERSSPRKVKSTVRYSGMHHPVMNVDNGAVSDQKIVTIVNQITPHSRVSWHGGRDTHSTLIKIDWPIDNSINSLTASTLNSSPLTPLTPVYDPLESDSEHSENNKQTIKITNRDCDSCQNEKCLKCELKECPEYNPSVDFKAHHPVKEFGMTLDNTSPNLHDSLESSPVHSPTNISYQNLNRLSAISTNSSNSEPNSAKDKKDHPYENLASDVDKRNSIMTSSHESSSSYSNVSPTKQGDELYECYSFTRPNYINLQSSGTSKSSSISPLKSPLRSTISITFKSPTKLIRNEYENLTTPTNDAERDSLYEDVDLDKNLSIVEEATVPEIEGNLPTQNACEPQAFTEDLIILETPIEESQNEPIDIYSQVKFFKKSVEEVNAMIMESNDKTGIETDDHEEGGVYENVSFTKDDNIYENIDINTQNNCDKIEKLDIKPNDNNIVELKIDDNIVDVEDETAVTETHIEAENGNIIPSDEKIEIKANLNVRQLAHKFESPTEQKPAFNFEKPARGDSKYSTMERNKESQEAKREVTVRLPPPTSPKTHTLTRTPSNARSLDENAFVKEFGGDKKLVETEKNLELSEPKAKKLLPDLNLNTSDTEASKHDSVTPTTENKICLIQRFNDARPDLRSLLGYDAEKKLSRERIEKYKEERRNFLREKYSSQSFRTVTTAENLSRLRIKKHDDDVKIELDKSDRIADADLPKFERRNTVDLGQRMRFSLAKSANNLDSMRDDAESRERKAESSDGAAARRSSGCHFERKEKVSPSYNIRDMAAMFEQKSQNTNTG
ncbi:hypothetical protein EVAR_41901_1 [Eumeta japonica]|uniref:Uncharacterized protein n=1 Tax=Eumeta variegata TaxID=151549 RepID=A0A4C1YJ16_EUMVA|nr:hypothetical protein EVAR_41901_1 [Eumeta japonica]